MKINSAGLGISSPTTTAPAPASGDDFAGRLKAALDAVEGADLHAERKAEQAARGEASLHDVALALERADVSMRLMVKSREKVVSAYQEIMRMSL
ncbi:MAG: flagellar hook-basal body complex protein FliE [Myxococcota bacterium]